MQIVTMIKFDANSNFDVNSASIIGKQHWKVMPFQVICFSTLLRQILQEQFTQE